MSKCSVFNTWKSSFLYWTLLRPKYWAEAGEANSVDMRMAADPRVRRHEGGRFGIFLTPPASGAPSAIRRTAQVDLHTVGPCGAVLSDRPGHFFARRLSGRAAPRVGQRLHRFLSDPSSDQILQRDRYQLAPAKRRIRLGQRPVRRIEQTPL